MKLGELISQLEDLRDTVMGVGYDTEVQVQVPGDGRTYEVTDTWVILRSRPGGRPHGTVVIEL